MSIPDRHPDHCRRRGAGRNTPINLAFGHTDDVNGIRVNHVVERNEYTNAHDVGLRDQTTVDCSRDPEIRRVTPERSFLPIIRGVM
jgi:hypothetical protein